MIYGVKANEKIENLFGSWQETIIWSCLRDVMGEIYVNDRENPTAAMAVLGDFCFLAGKPDREIAAYKPKSQGKDFMIMVPQNRGWAAMVECCYKEKAKKVVRYAFKKEPETFDIMALKIAAESLPEEYTLKKIDKNLFEHCKEMEWCRDLVSQYSDFEMYRKYGMGVAVLKNGEILSGASSYSGYPGGIEIEIDTREDYRRRGLARACGARLILECLERGWYPSWDAQNPWSAALAEKLGYRFSHVYEAYEITGY